MKSLTMAAMAAGLALGLGAGAALSAPGADGPPANLKPSKVDGAGLNVMDLEAQKAWYSAKLGMTLTGTIKAADGSPREYLMGYGGGPEAAIVALLKSPARQPGPNAMGRIILGVPDAKGLADWLKTQGVEARTVIPNAAYFIADPEGNAIELYTPPKP
jgi:catechol 2,3-dioxygenase-like lactoylglutathione lyase family enzyme